MAKSKKHAKPINLKSTKNYKKHQERVKLNHEVIKKLTRTATEITLVTD